MKKTKKTYGVYNIVEWMAIIKAGKASVRVLFSGGAMTTQGVTPAMFTTTDPVVQLAIEHSEPFRNGKIKLIKTYPTQEDFVVERNRPTAETAAAEERSEAEAPQDEQEAGKPAKVKVQVSCARDAAEYLRDNHGIALSKLHSKAAIAAAAEQYGVEFEYVAGEDPAQS